MAHNFFGLKFGIKTSSHEKRHVYTSAKTKMMNIPPADDILEFNYPPESRFHNHPDTNFHSGN